jgi:hypothetical protein
MTPIRPFARRVRLAAVCIGALVWAPPFLGAQSATPQVMQQSMSLQMRSVAQQLGAKLNPDHREELSLGVTLNGTLQEPEKLQKFGISGVHKGARVTAMRVAPQKLIVEVDEIEPEPLVRKATLKVDEQGRLSAP